MKRSTQFFIYFLIIGTIFSTTGCNKGEGTQLKELKNGNYDVILVKDNTGIFWAIPVVSIKSYQEDKLLIKRSSVVAKGLGNENSDIDIVDNFMKKDLVSLMLDYTPGEFGRQSFSYPGYASGQLMEIQAPTEIVAIELIDKVKKQ